MIKRFILPKKQLEKQLNFEKQIIREYQSACYVRDLSSDAEKERVERAKNNVDALTTLLKNYASKREPQLGDEVFVIVPYYSMFNKDTIVYMTERDKITGVEWFVGNCSYRTTHYDNVPSNFVFLSYDEAQEKKIKLEIAGGWWKK